MKYFSLFGLGSLITLLFIGAGCAGTPSVTPENCVASVLSETSNSGAGINANVGGVKISELAQSFKVSAEKKVQSVDIKLRNMSVQADFPGGVLTLRIVEANGNDPDSDDQALGVAAISQLSKIVKPSSEFRTFTFAGPVTLRSGKTYFLKLQASYPMSAESYIYWAGSNEPPAQGETPGALLYNPDTKTWSVPTNTKNFIYKVGCEKI